MSIKHALVPEAERYENSRRWPARDRFFGRLLVTRSFESAGAVAIAAGAALVLYGEYESANALTTTGYQVVGAGALTVAGAMGAEAILTTKHRNDLRVHTFAKGIQERLAQEAELQSGLASFEVQPTELPEA